MLASHNECRAHVWHFLTSNRQTRTFSETIEAIFVAGADVLPMSGRLMDGLIPAYNHVGDAVLLRVVFAVFDIMREKKRMFRDPLAYFFKLFAYKWQSLLHHSDNDSVKDDKGASSSFSSSLVSELISESSSSSSRVANP